MLPTDLNPDDLDDLVQILKDAEIRDVGFDPKQLNKPGVWVNVTGFALELLGGLTVKTQLICLAGTNDPRQALISVAPVFNKVVTALNPIGGPTGDPTTGVWILDGAARVSGISIPFDLHTTQE